MIVILVYLVTLSQREMVQVLKFLMERNSISALHGAQITVGTLILQDCAVGLLFALLPVLGGTSGVLQGVCPWLNTLAILIAFLAALFVLSRTWVSWFQKVMTIDGSLFSGVMISTTDLAQHTLEQVRSQSDFM